MAPKPPPPPPAPAPKNKWVVSATELKTLGNEAFTRKPNPDYYSAAQRYTHALRELDESGADNEPEPLALRCTLLQNRAACRLNLRYYQQCIDDCNEALAFDFSRTKARYRRGLAYEGLQRYAEAAEDLKAVFAVDASKAVEDAMDRVEIRHTLEGLKCEWSPYYLAQVFTDEGVEAPVDSRVFASLADKGKMRKAVELGWSKCCAAAAARRCPSPSVLKLLGVYSSHEHWDMARARCILLATRNGLKPQSWFDAAVRAATGHPEADWDYLVAPLLDKDGAMLMKLGCGLPGPRESCIPGQPEIEHVAPPPPTFSGSSSSSSSTSSSGGGRKGCGGVIGSEERGGGGGKGNGMAAGAGRR